MQSCGHFWQKLRLSNWTLSLMYNSKVYSMTWTVAVLTLLALANLGELKQIESWSYLCCILYWICIGKGICSSFFSQIWECEMRSFWRWMTLFKLVNVSAFELQSIWSIDCDLSIRWIESKYLKMTKAILIFEFWNCKKWFDQFVKLIDRKKVDHK